MKPRPTWILSLLRALFVALLVFTSSGLAAQVSASLHVHDGGDRCADCGPDCPRNCDSKSCPPGPLCRGTQPVVVVGALLRIPVAHVIPVAAPTFVVDTRLPASFGGEGVFHPPRPLA